MTPNDAVELKRSEQKFNFRKNLGVFVIPLALVVICVIFQILTSGVFLTPRNISNLFRQMTIVGILSVGMSFVLISGNYDLSVGSVTGVTGVMASLFIADYGMNVGLAIIIALVVGLAIGLMQGYFVAYLKLPSFIVTFAGLMIFRGCTFVLAGNRVIQITEEDFLYIGAQYLAKTPGYIVAIIAVALCVYLSLNQRRTRLAFSRHTEKLSITVLKCVAICAGIALFIILLNYYEGVPLVVLLLLILAVLFTIILTKLKFGKYVYAIGCNIKAAQLSGINVSRITMLCFVIMGLLSAITGVVLTSRVGQAYPYAGDFYEMDAISACVVGGISLSGGKGNIINALVGALIITSLSNGMTMLNADVNVQYIVKGLFFIFAVWFDARLSDKRAV